jgi:endonuclease III-like uncharacterized protein
LKKTNGLLAQRRTIINIADRIENEQTSRRVTLLPGDGIGPEICDSVVGVFQAAGC